MNREIVFFFACVLLTACGLNKQINTNNVSKPSSAKALITSIESKNKSPDWLSLKGKINLEKDGQKLNFSTDIRIKKDSIIWMSIKGPFGIELFRAQITKDSVFFLNNLKSTYVKSPNTELDKHLKTQIKFTQIQKIFFGIIEIPKVRYSFLESEKEYSLLAKQKNIRFLIEKQDFRIIDATFQKSENDYFQTQITDYFKSEDGFLIPRKLKLDVNGIEKFTLELNFTKMICNKKQNIQFFIPDKYVESN